MRIIPKANTLRKGILLYRGIRYRKGFGVHSPFVFNLITKVIEERCQYYSFSASVRRGDESIARSYSFWILAKSGAAES